VGCRRVTRETATELVFVIGDGDATRGRDLHVSELSLDRLIPRRIRMEDGSFEGHPSNKRQELIGIAEIFLGDPRDGRPETWVELDEVLAREPLKRFAQRRGAHSIPSSQVAGTESLSWPMDTIQDVRAQGLLQLLGERGSRNASGPSVLAFVPGQHTPPPHNAPS
jgi:hypothetical protein